MSIKLVTALRSMAGAQDHGNPIGVYRARICEEAAAAITRHAAVLETLRHAELILNNISELSSAEYPANAVAISKAASEGAKTIRGVL